MPIIVSLPCPAHAQSLSKSRRSSLSLPQQQLRHQQAMVLPHISSARASSNPSLAPWCSSEVEEGDRCVDTCVHC